MSVVDVRIFTVTGSGKTFSMLGKPKLGIVGLLPKMLGYVVENRAVTKVELRCVEAFGHHVAKINLYDLFNPENQNKVWKEKIGSTGLDMTKTSVVEIKDADDAHHKIIVSTSIVCFVSSFSCFVLRSLPTRLPTLLLPGKTRSLPEDM